MANSVETAIRNYLVALKDPAALRDEERITRLQQSLDSSDDQLERLQLQQQILDLSNPSVERFEEEFVTHARAWADKHGISARAFSAEGVPAAVLRKAGFGGVGRGRVARRGTRPAGGRGRTRVRAEDVRAAMPTRPFTVKQLQETSGASPAVVRRVVREDLEAKALEDAGVEESHAGPGRAPRLYRRR
ncbi:MAG: hypothetical protein KY434_04530 [Actinobacteria bacterium]|nr:hypothetical protein [Actinomycetota bacterium]